MGIEQFSLTHEMGSHAGQSRIIRKAYFEHPDYVPLLERAYLNWREFEEEWGKKIYYRTGLFYFGEPGNPITGGVLKSAALYNVPVETLSQSDAQNRFPVFNLPAGYEYVFEPDAGFLRPEEAIRGYASLAQSLGAKILTNTAVNGWRMLGDSIVVDTSAGEFECEKLVVTAGAWTGKLIADLSNQLKVTKQSLVWTNPTSPDQFALGNFPCWLMSDPERGPYYGFPILDPGLFGAPAGLKSAHHFPAVEFDPTQSDREINADTEEDIRYALSKWLPAANGEILAMKSCLYTNAPDENFIIDQLPGSNGKITVACGTSGHGFKFASVIGEILSDLSTNGKTEMPIEFLSLKRFAGASYHH